MLRVLPRVRQLRELLMDIDTPVVLSFLGATNLTTIAACQGLGRRVVISERNDPAKQALQPPWNALRRALYEKADVVTANSRGACETMTGFCDANKLRVVPNPLDVPSITAGQTRSPRVVTVARLVHQKGIDVLIEAFGRAAPEVPGWHLDILGDGPMLERLKAQARRLGITERVTFHGYVDDPWNQLCAAEVFVLPSRFEGMPNSLLEAMACGLATIVSDASPGPLEYVKHGESGLVVGVEDVAGLAEAICLLARDKALRRRYGEASRALMNELRIDRIAEVWEDILELPEHASPRMHAA